MTKREAWAALDAARIPAWRTWKTNFHSFKDNGASFEEALEKSVSLLHQELEPYYNAAKEAL